MSNAKPMNPRNARTPDGQGPFYVIAHGAPQHYVDGYSLVGPGSVVTLGPGVDPGKWMVEVSPEDAAKAGASETDAQRLAVLAAAKIKAQANTKDVERKQAADQVAIDKAAAEAQAKAQAEADAIAKLAKADAETKAASDQANAEKQRADDLQKQLDKANADLAAAQSQLEKATAADADKAKSETKASDKPAAK